MRVGHTGYGAGMGDSEETSAEEIGEAARDADQELGELDQEGDAMEERLESAGDEASEVQLPEPGEIPEPVDEADGSEDDSAAEADES